MNLLIASELKKVTALLFIYHICTKQCNAMHLSHIYPVEYK